MPAVQPIPTIDEIIEKVKEYNPSSDSDMLRRAYQLALQAHGDQKRDSGEPYIMHPLAVAAILADLELDDATIAAGLLHIPYHTCTKWHERKSCHFKKLLPKWNSNNRNAPKKTNYQIPQCHFPAKEQDPN